jgi:hypothetical protein
MVLLLTPPSLDILEASSVLFLTSLLTSMVWLVWAVWKPVFAMVAGVVERLLNLEFALPLDYGALGFTRTLFIEPGRCS